MPATKSSGYRFGPRELVGLFERYGMKAVHVAGICPFFDFLPTQEQASILEEGPSFETMAELERQYAEDPCVVGLSGRLLIVARARPSGS